MPDSDKNDAGNSSVDDQSRNSNTDDSHQTVQKNKALWDPAAPYDGHTKANDEPKDDGQKVDGR